MRAIPKTGYASAPERRAVSKNDERFDPLVSCAIRVPDLGAQPYLHGFRAVVPLSSRLDSTESEPLDRVGSTIRVGSEGPDPANVGFLDPAEVRGYLPPVRLLKEDDHERLLRALESQRHVAAVRVPERPPQPVVDVAL